MTTYGESAKRLSFKQFVELFETHLPYSLYTGEEQGEMLTKEWERLTGKILKKELKKEAE
jgi:hypothetical protein